ncbi:PAS domain-containing protein [bacterium BFN5]|nr:PAS domain-containing protein [bacterium BFN5]QJW45228.1 PAS domain-containing protein [bacterium BFN5]
MKSSVLARKTYVLATMIITIPMILFGWMNASNTRERIIAEKEQTLLEIAVLLQLKFPDSYEAVLKQNNPVGDEQEKLLILHQRLQPVIDDIVQRYPEYGMGYGMFEQRIAFYPFNQEVFKKPISSWVLSVYDKQELLWQVNTLSGSWNEPAMVLIYPLSLDGKVIGHIWVNAKVGDINQAIYFAWAQNLVILITTWLGLIFLLQKAFSSIGQELKDFSASIEEKNDCYEQLTTLPELQPLRAAVIGLREGLEQEKDEVQNALLAVHQTLDRITDFFYALDMEFRFIYINSKMAELYQSAVIGELIWDALPAVARFSSQFKRALAEQMPVSFTAFSPTIQKWLEVNIYPSPHGLTVYMKDIHDKKLAQNQLKEQTRLIDLVQDPIMMWDWEGTVIFWNGGAEKSYGWSKAEAIGQKICALIQTQFPQGLDKHKQELLERGYWEGELIDICKDRRRIVVKSHWTINKDASGKVSAVFVINRDITEQRKIEEELARFDSLHTLGEMAAGIGHEVRNPLTTVRGYLQVFSYKGKFLEYQEQFHTMIEELDRANSIITEFLSLAKNKSLNMECLNLNDIIRPLFPLLQADGFRLGHDVQLELSDIPKRCFVQKEIRQLILNLVRNGFEAMTSPGQVTIRTYTEPGAIVLVIRDTGTGIPAEMLDKLGTPFLTTKDSGTGLGLPVCYRVAERHEAQIELDTSPQGTTFYIKFKA